MCTNDNISLFHKQNQNQEKKNLHNHTLTSQVGNLRFLHVFPTTCVVLLV